MRRRPRGAPTGALLVAGLAQGERELVARGLADRLHQDRRAHLFPQSFELLGQARELGALGATVSGAGPAVLVWCDREHVAAVADGLRARSGGWAEVLDAPLAGEGVTVELSG